ncbi:MAG: hypothetical protein JOZ57_17285 [Abitibacteriaceae bacterium]|nr:hypothetical protein [Abditibacteriaceae bacterium]
MSAHVCVQCGSSDLSDPTFFLSFGCLTRLITWGLVLLALWKLTPLATRVTGITAEKVISQTSIVPIIEICWRLFIFGLICYWVLSWVLSTLPGEPGKQLRNLVLGTLNFFIKQGWRWLQILAKGAFHLLRSLVEGDNRTKH